MAAETYFQTLGLHRGATITDVRRAFRRLALLHHPDHDHTFGARRRFVRILEAYRILTELVGGDDDVRVAACEMCGQTERLFPHTDGRSCCGSCLLGGGGRLLPAPFARLVRFYGVMLLLACSTGLCLLGGQTRQLAALAAALGCAMVAMAWLATTTVWIAYCDPSRAGQVGRARRSPRGHPRTRKAA
jgi:hypothetical protein